MKRATTSASNISRRVECPGSGNEEAKFSNPDSEYSAEGTLLHSIYMAHPSVVDEITTATPLTVDQQHVIIFAEQITNEFITRFMTENGIPDDAERHIIREIEMSFSDATGTLFPGHADLIITWPAHSARVVVDLKSGFMEVEDAADNYQLATYACMAQQREPVKLCGVAIVQPRNFGPKCSSAIYSMEAMRDAAAVIARAFHDSEVPNAPLVAGESQCHFCRAKAACPAYRDKFSQIEITGETAVETIDNETLVKLKRAIRFAKKISDEVDDEMKRRITAGLLDGWKLRGTGDVTTCEDASGLFASLKNYLKELNGTELSAVDFDTCRSLTWGKLTELVQQKAGVSEKAAKKIIDDISVPYVTKTPKAQAVVEVKAK